MAAHVGEERDIALRLRNVSKTFPGVQALRGIDIDVERGSVHAILGHNGCGKSTLVKALAGVHAPDHGAEAWVDGSPLQLGSAKDAEAHGLRFVHQELGIIPELGAADNVGLVRGYERRFGRIRWGKQEKVTRELLDRFGLTIDPRKPLSEASPPERTAVAIVRAVAGWQAGEGVLVLDEPTASLPASEADELFRLIREVRDSGTAVILISHRLDEVVTVADHATVMRDGAIIWDGAITGMSTKDLVQLISDGHDDAWLDRSLSASPVSFSDRPVAFSVENLEGRYLRGFSLQVAEGEVVGVAGLLGSGREELPYLVAGAEKATAGTITVGDKTASSLSIAEARELGIALVPADRAKEGIISSFTTRENVSLASLPGITHSGFLSPPAERAFSRKWLDSVSADKAYSERLITTLSGGNQQKAVLARWLSAGPHVLVLSEPTAGVDVGARMILYEELRRRAEDGLAVLMCSSDVEDLLSSCDRVVVVRDGLVAAEFRGDRMTKNAITRAMEGVHDEQPSRI